MIRIFQKFVPNVVAKMKQESKPIGRWNLEQCQIKTIQKVDLSNEDHCGPCGQYALQQLEKKSTQPLQNVPTSSHNISQ